MADKIIELNEIKMIVRNFLQCSIAGGYLCPRILRRWIYNALGNHIKTNSINSGCILMGRKLHIDTGSFINSGVYFDCTDKIIIGKNVFVGMRTTFITSSHVMGSAECRAGDGITAPIYIEDGVWIGGNVTILPGVTIKKGAMVSAGAVVVRDCEENCIYSGCPARILKTLE